MSKKTSPEIRKMNGVEKAVIRNLKTALRDLEQAEEAAEEILVPRYKELLQSKYTLEEAAKLFNALPECRLKDHFRVAWMYVSTDKP